MTESIKHSVYFFTITSKYGGIAQLGERLNGIQEASGSIPLISTKNPDCLRNRDFYFLPLHYYSISKCLESGRASVFLGIVSFRTPFSYFALISSAFTPDKSKSRLYEP